MQKENKFLLTESTTLRVRYGETDQMGYCYYGNYAQYFEVGRVEALRSLGMSYRDLEDIGVMLPVSDFQVKYRAPAKYDDELTIVTHITSVSGARITFDYEIYNESDQLIATASTTLVFVDKHTMRPSKPPVEFMELFDK
ncbi:MAG: acyl-CoA thioesterase [Bacteroidota bacterium]